MVTIINFKEKQREDGRSFYVLEIQGGMDLVMSKNTGMYYATTKHANLPCTYNEDECIGLLGTEIPGSITRVECDPYEYLVKETGETIMVNHRYIYVPDETEILQQLQNTKDSLSIASESFRKSVAFEHEFAS